MPQKMFALKNQICYFFSFSIAISCILLNKGYIYIYNYNYISCLSKVACYSLLTFLCTEVVYCSFEENITLTSSVVDPDPEFWLSLARFQI